MAESDRKLLEEDGWVVGDDSETRWSEVGLMPRRKTIDMKRSEMIDHLLIEHGNWKQTPEGFREHLDKLDNDKLSLRHRFMHDHPWANKGGKVDHTHKAAIDVLPD